MAKSGSEDKEYSELQLLRFQLEGSRRENDILRKAAKRKEENLQREMDVLRARITNMDDNEARKQHLSSNLGASDENNGPMPLSSLGERGPASAEQHGIPSFATDVSQVKKEPNYLPSPSSNPSVIVESPRPLLETTKKAPPAAIEECASSALETPAAAKDCTLAETASSSTKDDTIMKQASGRGSYIPDPEDLIDLQDPLLPNQPGGGGNFLTRSMEWLIKTSPDQVPVQNPPFNLLTALLFAAWVVTLSLLLKDKLVDTEKSTCSNDVPEELSRAIKIWNCVSGLHDRNQGLQLRHESSAKTSRHLDTVEDSPQRTALAWLWTGAGRDLPVDEETCSSWDSPFATMYALLIARESLRVTNPSWHMDKPLQQLSDICDWKYLTCDAQSNVKAIKMSYSNLAGFIPMELMRIGSLEYLDLDNNVGIHGSIPNQIGSLTHLERLLLHDTSLDGKIPTELGLLTNLKQVLLDKTKLTGTMPAEVCRLRHDGALDELGASCGGDEPMIHCDRPSCCTFCTQY